MAATMQRSGHNSALRVILRRCSCSRGKATVAPKAASSELIKDEQEGLYPPIRPKYPPGTWGAMEPKMAWLWQKWADEYRAIENIPDRIKKLGERKFQVISFKVKELYPRALPFYEYATKTHIVEGHPAFYDTISKEEVQEVAAGVKPLVLDAISMEHSLSNRDNLPYSSHAVSRKEYRGKLLVSCILRSLQSAMVKWRPHLRTTVADEDVKVAAFWERHGFERKALFERIDNYTHYRNLYYPDYHRLQATYKADFTLRHEQPIPEFLPHDDLQCMGEMPALKFKPHSYGQTYIPKQSADIVAGYSYGDPNEFTFLCALNGHWSEWMEEKYGAKYAEEARLIQGIAGSFSLLAAQAYYLGFSHLLELTYPLTTQTMVTDGQNFLFLAYQLNTLQLWKDNEGNPRQNVCWYSPTQPLYRAVSKGKVEGFSDEVLQHLVKLFLVTPGDRGVEYRPYLPSGTPDARDTTYFIQPRVEEVVVKEEETYV